jgi:CheY-like chemotaxis protein
MIISQPRPAPPLSVLLVDDEPGVLETLTDILEMEGCAVQHAATVAETLALVETWAYDLVLLDYLLPDGTGLDVLRRSDTSRQRCIVLTTGLTESVIIDQALALGASAIIHKPIRVEALMELLSGLGRGEGCTEAAGDAGMLVASGRDGRQ